MAERSARYRRAWLLAYENFAELRCGTESAPSSMTHPCPWLVWAVLNLWDRYGEGNAKPSAVLVERNRLLPGVDEQEAKAA